MEKLRTSCTEISNSRVISYIYKRISVNLRKSEETSIRRGFTALAGTVRTRISARVGKSSGVSSLLMGFTSRWSE